MPNARPAAVGSKVIEPSADEQRISHQLVRHIQQHCQQHGPMPFSRYMETCLYQPGLGYYAADHTIFGAAGDFITAPELGGLFAQGLARQCERISQPMAGDNVLMEVGAGSGQLAKDLLLALMQRDALPDQYWILERSASLRRRQEAGIRELPRELRGRVRWLDQAPAESFNGVIIANEVLDALPVERVTLDDGQWRRQGIDWREDGGHWCGLPMTAALSEAVAQIESDLPTPFASPYSTEINLNIRPWLADISRCLNQGAVILVDYGYPRREYYHAQRHGGTLVCHYRHRAHDNPLRWPGLQDLTAFVDFTAVAEAADAAGLAVVGYTSQAQFLLASGVLEELARIAEPLAMARLAEEARQLMLPGEMGEKFQVMMLGRDLDDDELAFAVDYRHRL